MAFRDLLATLFSHRRLTPSLEVVRVEVQVEDLPPELEGLTVGQVSDLHVGHGNWFPVRARDAAKALAEARPDVMINTGDFLQENPPLEHVRDHVEPFLIERKPEVEGPVNLAVLGNHDYYAGEETVEELKNMLRRIGVCPLVNETAVIRRNGAEIHFSGLEEREDGFDRMVADMSEQPRPHVVLLHEADFAERLPARSADLVLAGHTHGGQITFPGLKGAIVRRFSGSKYIEGRYRVNENPVYINRGLGYTGLPIRFRARPEVTIFRLHR